MSQLVLITKVAQLERVKLELNGEDIDFTRLLDLFLYLNSFLYLF
jgi:hypothetical protein